MPAAASMTDFIASARRADICARDSALMKTLYDGASRFRHFKVTIAEETTRRFP